jgi:hypothetical protein
VILCTSSSSSSIKDTRPFKILCLMREDIVLYTKAGPAAPTR